MVDALLPMRLPLIVKDNAVSNLACVFRKHTACRPFSRQHGIQFETTNAGVAKAGSAETSTIAAVPAFASHLSTTQGLQIHCCSTFLHTLKHTVNADFWWWPEANGHVQGGI